VGNEYIGPESKIRLRAETWIRVDSARGQRSRSAFIRAIMETLFPDNSGVEETGHDLTDTS